MAGRQVFLPLMDHGHKTTLLVCDGSDDYRIQIKTIKAQDELPRFLLAMIF
jgi:hypothetical protein